MKPLLRAKSWRIANEGGTCRWWKVRKLHLTVLSAALRNFDVRGIRQQGASRSAARQEGPLIIFYSPGSGHRLPMFAC